MPDTDSDCGTQLCCMVGSAKPTVALLAVMVVAPLGWGKGNVLTSLLVHSCLLRLSFPPLLLSRLCTRSSMTTLTHKKVARSTERKCVCQSQFVMSLFILFCVCCPSPRATPGSSPLHLRPSCLCSGSGRHDVGIPSCCNALWQCDT